jgi:hypothetical protein
MRRLIDLVYLLHFLSITTLLVGGFRLLGETKGVRGFDVNPNFAKRVLSHKRVVAVGMWGLIATGLVLVVAGFEIGFMGGRIPFLRRPLPPGLLLGYLLLMVVLIAATLHPMVAITYRIVPTIMAKPGNLTPEEGDELVRRLRLNATLLTAIIVIVLAAGALRWLYAAGVLF